MSGRGVKKQGPRRGRLKISCVLCTKDIRYWVRFCSCERFVWAYAGTMSSGVDHGQESASASMPEEAGERTGKVPAFSSKQRLGGLIAIVIGIACAMCLYLQSERVAKHLLGARWNSESMVQDIKHATDALALILIVLCAMLFVLIHFKVLNLSERKRTWAEIINLVVVVVTAFMTIRVSQVLSDRAFELSPLQGISSRYNLDGTQTINLFGSLLLPRPTKNVEVFKRIVELQVAGKWTNLLFLCDNEIAKTPDWLTPYLARSIAYANLEQLDLARKDCEFVIKQARGDAQYAQAAQVLEVLDRYSVLEKQYSGLNNVDLKSESMRLVTEIREFGYESETSERLALAAELEEQRQTFGFADSFKTNRTKLEETARSRNDKRVKRELETSLKYSRRFQLPVMVLRKELLARLRKEGWSSVRPQDFRGLQTAPDDLEHFARSLTNAGNKMYSRMSNKELKAETLKFVNRLGLFIAQNKQKEDEMWNTALSQSSTTNREVMRQRFTQRERDYDCPILTQKGEYNKSFRVEALILRDVLLSRFTKGSAPSIPRGFGLRSRSADDLSYFAWCADAGRFEFVSESLEVLGSGLP